jgi:hypothetical protein
MIKQKFTRARIQEILQSGAGLDIYRTRELTGRIIEALAAAIEQTKRGLEELRGPYCAVMEGETIGCHAPDHPISPLKNGT